MVNQTPHSTVPSGKIQSIAGFFGLIQKYMASASDFFRNKKYNSKTMLFVAIVMSAIAIYFVVQVVQDIRGLNAKTPQLINLTTYDLRILQNNLLTQGAFKGASTINDLIDENATTISETKKYKDYIDSLQVPYTYFLQYLYLPSLNIWKQPYTNVIDTNLIGLNFLQNNPFDDIVLLQKWGDFFKNLGDNHESNDIQNIDIGDITEDGKGYFTMPITVSFVANSKRSFLLLADKLSMTSNKTNISLINEFFYYLRGEIKKGKEKEINELAKKYTALFATGEKINNDKIIGYHLYNRVMNSQDNVLIDDDIINKTIKSVVSCNKESDELCYYRFRERYRDIPTFGYLLGTDFSTNGTENLKQFIRQLPPLFAIKDLQFDKVKSPTVSDVTNVKYQGKVTIVVYGRSASASDVEEITQSLGKKCFGVARTLTLEDSLSRIKSAILKVSDVNKIDKGYADNLLELQAIVEQTQKDLPTLSNYKKTIKYFELYRMLNDAGFCN